MHAKARAMYSGYFLWRKIMAISKYTADREKQKFLESDAVAGQVAVAVVNPDGSSLSGTGTTSMQVQGASADNAPVTENPVLTGGEYNATPPTYGDGDKTTRQDDVNGNQKVREQYAPLYEDNVAQRALTEQRFTPGYISTATTTTLKTGSGLMHAVIVQGGTTGTIIIYDNTAASGTILASFDTTNALASYMFNVSFATGLTVVTSAATKLTVSYR